MAARLKFRPRLGAIWYNLFVREKVIPKVMATKPDLLLFLLPYALAPDNRNRLQRAGSPIVTWATDSLCRYGRHSGPWEVATKNYLFDGGDVRGGSDSWLPLGFDEEIFRPVEDKSWDVLFVGRLFAKEYAQRIRFLELLLSSDLMEGRKVAMAGSIASPLRSVKQQVHQSRMTLLGALPIPELARTIAASRISISVHQDSGTQPVNPMLFAITGCRSCLLTDRRDYLSRWLKPGREFVQAGPNDLIAVLRSLLGDGGHSSEVATRGHQASHAHTWVRRIETILDDLQFPPRGKSDHPSARDEA